MTSTAFYKAASPPKLCYTFTGASKRLVEIYETTCIVTNFTADVLINPANPELSGVSRFPYFPRGGPVPETTAVSGFHRDWQPLGHVSTWGGMDVGHGMMYPVSVVDGLVHLHGGVALQAELAYLRLLQSSPCPVGSAVRTGRLGDTYRAVVHTTPPFYREPDAARLLRRCYESALILSPDDESTIACPLLGAGARGFPESMACQVAAEAVAVWLQQGDGCHHQCLRFGVLSATTADCLAEAILSTTTD